MRERYREVTMGRWPTPPSLSRVTDLERPGSLGLPPTKIELSSNRQAHKEPIAEAEVVDKQENIFHSEVDECHGTLEGEGMEAEVGTVTTRPPQETPATQQSAPDLPLTDDLAYQVTSSSFQ